MPRNTRNNASEDTFENDGIEIAKARRLARQETFKIKRFNDFGFSNKSQKHQRKK